MKRRMVSAIMVKMLLTSMLMLAFNVQPAKGWTGTVYIRADGSIDPPTAPISTVDNVTYTLTGNIISYADGIVVERSNIKIDGAGYTVKGTGDYPYHGIYLSNIMGVTIRNINAESFSSGILLDNYSSNNTISGNNITNNGDGIYLWYSSNNFVYHNNFINNTEQAFSYGSVNVWDDGYPSGGNYWSDYTGVDADGDGIGDTPYIIDEYNRDRYPLMNPWTPPLPPTYSLTVTTTVGGTTDPAPGTYNYTAGTKLNVTAIPDVGYSFNCWLLDGEVRTENPITIVMDSNHTLEAHFVDDIPPEISEPVQDPPEDVEPYQNVTVTVNVTDYGTGIYNVTLWYSLNNGTTWTIVNMTAYREIYEALWGATIPGYENCTWVTYKIVAYDNAENMAVNDNNGYNYQYHVIPEFPSATILPLFLTSALLAIIFSQRKQKSKLKTI